MDERLADLLWRVRAGEGSTDDLTLGLEALRSSADWAACVRPEERDEAFRSLKRAMVDAAGFGSLDREHWLGEEDALEISENYLRQHDLGLSGLDLALHRAAMRAHVRRLLATDRGE
ncbi:MAG: hypothetical protein DI629_07285 [Mesorhizobium amorphae]|nr:MAG: hypothetical protein DI629_07285 [Mesorhizobium amorphae]